MLDIVSFNKNYELKIMNWLVIDGRHMVITHFFSKEDFSANICEKKSLKWYLDCIKSIESRWHKRNDYVKRKITFKIGQRGAVHFTYSFISLLWFNLMPVYLYILDSNSFSGKSGLISFVQCFCCCCLCCFPKLTQ